MLKRVICAVVVLGLVAGVVPFSAEAAVSVTTGPTSLVTDPTLLKASSSPKGLFEVTLTATASETLSSIMVLVNTNGTTTVSSGDLAGISVYKDNGAISFDPAVDTLLATQTAVGVGTSTTVGLGTTTPATGKFFVSLQTSSTWSGNSPADSVTVTLPANAITTSDGTVTSSAVTTASITADTTGPSLVSAIAKNTGGTSAKEAGDSVELTFSESTNKPTLTSGNITSFLTLNNGHSFLDQSGNLGATAWNVAGNILTITLTGTSTPTSTLPSVVVGDVVTVVTSTNFTDIAGNQTTGTQAITGDFGGVVPGDGGDEEVKGNCANSLINGRLYKIGTSPTVYLAAACRLKPFRGNAVFKARGQKFQNIITLSSAPSNVTISEQPVLPTPGTLVKGKDKTVWFVGNNGKRKGFVSGEHFLGLGFKFEQVQTIAETDLSLVPVDVQIIQPGENHPDGSVIKCGNSNAVFQVIGGKKFPFASLEAFEGRGNSAAQILLVDCGRFRYVQGAPIN